MKITERNSTKPEWLNVREESVESVLYLFATISKRFEIDPNYGPEWVKNNQKIIAELVSGAMIEVTKSSKI